MKATSCITLGTTFHVDYQQHQKSNSPTHVYVTVCLITFNSCLSYNKHVCVRVCVCACVCNGRSPEVIRPLAKCYFFLWAMATVGQREGAQ